MLLRPFILALLGVTALLPKAASIDLPPGDFHAGDLDRDGALSLPEFAAARLAAFDAHDTDRSGTLDSSEAPDLFMDETVWSPDGGLRHRSGSPLGIENSARVSRLDYALALPLRFARLDADRTGALSRTEVEAAR